jgi:(1->4)-alpha-D-glucan 1-alpha-D-glucosylmutase
MSRLRIPSATYRLQFSGHFRFEQACALAGYLDELGVTDIYASPLLQARHGSGHGYDVTNPTHLNSEIGSEQELEALATELRQRHMGLLLDIVPNHMVAGSESPWWMDVLEDGPGSAYASFFDIDWHPPRTLTRNKVLLPILGRPYAAALENQELKLAFEQAGFFIYYFDTKLPVAPKSSLLVLQHRLDELSRKVGADHPAFRELGGILAATNSLPERTTLSTEMAGERRSQREAIKERIWNLYQNSPEVREFVDENVRVFNGRRRDPASFVFLDRLLAEQAYLLSYWLSANDEINYRRFFTITDLVGVRVEDPLVFEATHAVVLRLIEKGLVTGLRIDHVDGLRDPLGYLRRLQERVSGGPPSEHHPPFFVLVEKILADGEPLPLEWPSCGATGYASLNALNRLFIDPEGCKKLESIYESFTGARVSYDDLVYQKKKEVMANLLRVEMRSLGHYLALLAERDRYARDLPRSDLAHALVETTACLPVYRTYVRGFSIASEERRPYIRKALEAARRRNPLLRPECFDFISDVLLLRDRAHVVPEQREARLAFVMRWQQFTGPITAKGVEDSALYIYNRLISLNEVGGNPSSNGVSVAAFHEFLSNRQKHNRHTLTATTTHDTKRAEDVRARINVLSELPSLWEEKLRKWACWNESKKKLVDNRPVPDPNEEVLLYQTMLGAWPFNDRDRAAFRKRLQRYMVKATREAMVNTKWTRPNVRHERALHHFVAAITQESPDNAFLEDFLQVCGQVALYGAINSLAQLLLKITGPGVPDFYQGSELWDLRLVDPDNRGPVDFERRVRLLAELMKQEEQNRLDLIRDLLDHWRDGRIKLFVTSRALTFRRAHNDLYLDGSYEPLQAIGPKRENVFAFAKRLKRAWAVTAVPRLVTRLVPPGGFPTGQNVWADSALLLLDNAPAEWVNVLTGERMQSRVSEQGHLLPLGEVFARFPVAVLRSL